MACKNCRNKYPYKMLFYIQDDDGGTRCAFCKQSQDLTKPSSAEFRLSILDGQSQRIMDLCSLLSDLIRVDAIAETSKMVSQICKASEELQRLHDIPDITKAYED